MDQLFDRLAEGYDAYAHEAIGYRLPQAVLAALAPHLANARFGLDVGTGTGLLAALVRQASGAQFVGVDCSEQMLVIARRWGRVNHACRCDVAASGLPFRDVLFDVVVGCGVTEFVAPLRGLVREMTRVTREGGILALTYEVARVGPHVQVQEVGPVPCYAYRRAYCERVLRDAGLSVLSSSPSIGYVLDGIPVRHGVIVCRRVP